MAARIELHLDFSTITLPFAFTSGLASCLTPALASIQWDKQILMENNPKNNLAKSPPGFSLLFGGREAQVNRTMTVKTQYPSAILFHFLASCHRCWIHTSQNNSCGIFTLFLFVLFWKGVTMEILLLSLSIFNLFNYFHEHSSTL